MLIRTNNREEFIRALVNTWLQDKSWYCNNCGLSYTAGAVQCCDEPQIGRNIDHCRGIIKQNRELKETRKNDQGTNKDKTMRFAISLPPGLLAFLENVFKKQYNEKLFPTRRHLWKFMRNFREFTIPREV